MSEAPGGPGEERRRQLLQASPHDWGQPPRVVLDTDADNEVDDQFALAHLLLSPDRVRLQAVYAAPFHNERAAGPGEGMQRSLEEIHRVVSAVGGPPPPVLEGATEWLGEARRPLRPPAAVDLVERALASDAPLYVVAIAAPTNVAAALALAPEIVGRVVVVWLGGNAPSWPSAEEFNLSQDLAATRRLLDSGVAMVHVPCKGVADRLVTTRPEIDREVATGGDIGGFLAARYAERVPQGLGTSKVIWDLGASAWALDPGWASAELVPAPVLEPDLTWSAVPGRHLIAQVRELHRDAIFGDLFRRLRSGRCSGGGARPGG